MISQTCSSLGGVEQAKPEPKALGLTTYKSRSAARLGLRRRTAGFELPSGSEPSGGADSVPVA